MNRSAGWQCAFPIYASALLRSKSNSFSEIVIDLDWFVIHRYTCWLSTDWTNCYITVYSTHVFNWYQRKARRRKGFRATLCSSILLYISEVTSVLMLSISVNQHYVIRWRLFTYLMAYAGFRPHGSLYCSNLACNHDHNRHKLV